MKTRFLRMVALSLSVLTILAFFSGCGKNNKSKSTSAYADPTQSSLLSGEYTGTDDFSLSWDDEKKCVLLLDKKNNTYWSSIPYSYYNEEDVSGIGMVRMHSPIFIEYVSNKEIKTAYAKVEAINNGYVIASECDGGLRVTYYMPNIEISIPVEYTLCDNGLRVSLVVSDVCENENLLYSVSLSPFMCSAQNNTEDSYLFVPSGSGALMYVDEGSRNSRTYSDLVYGTDYATTINEKVTNKEKIAMPVYGAKQGENAICAIITDGAEIAQIDAEVGNEEYGYSAVWSTFILRGSNSLYVKDFQGNQGQISISTDDIVDIDRACVTYTPLADENANYIGMANVYRDYLKEKYEISSEKDFSVLYLKMLGGTVINKNTFGFSSEKLQVSTSYDEAEKMLDEIKNATGVNPVVQMTGFGESGLDIRKIASGYNLSGSFGDYRDFLEYCKKEDISCYFDFDVLHYNKGGSGIARYGDAATTVNKAIAKQYIFSPASYNKLHKNYYYYILKRDKVGTVTDKLLKYIKKADISGVSLSTLSNVSYSGYPDREEYNKLGFANVAENSFDKVKKADKSLMTSYAFDYAAVVSDCIVESPTKSSQSDGFDKEIPFYQIVMKGITPTAVSAVNLSINPQEQFIKAMETGSSLCFALCDEWNEDYTSSLQSVFQFALYDTWKNDVNLMVNSSLEYLTNVRDAYITDHKEIGNQVYCTVFSNGTTVYVNYSDAEVSTPAGQVKANNFKYVLAGG